MSAAPDQVLRDSLRCVRGVYMAEAEGSPRPTTPTQGAFSEKWGAMQQGTPDGAEGWKQTQQAWYLDLYGFGSEDELAAFTRSRHAILDAGCGVGYKAAWLAGLAPNTLVVAMDYSDAIHIAAQRYRDVPNLMFVRGDIAKTPFRDGAFDFISCDQVLHHTEDPPATLREFHRIAEQDCVLNTYVYARKALPRELLDEHFRSAAAGLSHQQLWELSEQLTQLGRVLSELRLTVDIPAIPLLGIKGGPQDLQRFIYWNFAKCFWNETFGHAASVATNFDWYAPAIAHRYSRDEFLQMCSDAGWRSEFLHGEEACWSGRFRLLDGTCVG